MQSRPDLSANGRPRVFAGRSRREKCGKDTPDGREQTVKRACKNVKKHGGNDVSCSSGRRRTIVARARNWRNPSATRPSQARRANARLLSLALVCVEVDGCLLLRQTLRCLSPLFGPTDLMGTRLSVVWSSRSCHDSGMAMGVPESRGWSRLWKSSRSRRLGASCRTLQLHA